MPPGPSGPYESPAIQSAFAIQDALNLDVSEPTIKAYLGHRFAGSWIINDGHKGVLYVGVVRLTQADGAYAKSHIHMGRGASISLVSERYTMTQLDSYQIVVSKYVEGHTKGKVQADHPFVGFGVYVPDNAVAFRVSRRDATYWIPRIQPLIPYDALVIEYSAGKSVAL